MAVNVDGAFFSTQAFGCRMQECGGSIVLISSISSFGATVPEFHSA
jgi:NAD(P)-dependent dehydrogenase (short-subunit alcohol dehydrogenase family)